MMSSRIQLRRALSAVVLGSLVVVSAYPTTEEDLEAVVEELADSSLNMDTMLENLEQVEEALAMQDHETERRNPTPVKLKSPIHNYDAKGKGVLPNMFMVGLKDGTSDSAYNALLAGMVKLAKTKYSKTKLPPYKVRGANIVFNGVPHGYYDMRPFDLKVKKVDDDKTAVKYHTTHVRHGRISKGPRGFFIYAPDEFAVDVAKHGEVSVVERNLEPSPAACQLQAQPANCNWGKPRVNYDRAGGNGSGFDPRSTGWWPQPVVCQNVNYDVDMQKVGPPVQVFMVDGGVHNHNDFGNRVMVAYERALNMFEGPIGNHGTHVAGIITSNTYGLAPRVTVTSFNGLNPSMPGSQAMINAYECIWRRAFILLLLGIQPQFVVSQSMGFSTPHPVNPSPQASRPAHSVIVETVMKQLVNTLPRGIYMSISAGNDNELYPADACNGLGIVGRAQNADDHIVVVGAHQDDDRRAIFSNSGPCVTLHAPGVGIRSTIAGNANGLLSGTSMSTPHVSAIMVRMLNDLGPNDPLPTPAQMRTRLRNLAKNQILPYNGVGALAHHAADQATTTDLRLFYYCG